VGNDRNVEYVKTNRRAISSFGRARVSAAVSPQRISSGIRSAADVGLEVRLEVLLQDPKIDADPVGLELAGVDRVADELRALPEGVGDLCHGKATLEARRVAGIHGVSPFLFPKETSLSPMAITEGERATRKLDKALGCMSRVEPSTC
jgi:hypothetical protein